MVLASTLIVEPSQLVLWPHTRYMQAPKLPLFPFPGFSWLAADPGAWCPAVDLAYEEWRETGKILTHVNICIVQAESMISSTYDLFNTGFSTEYGSRSFILQLEPGDTVGLIQESTGSASTDMVNLCVSLMKA